jgi:signal peptidase II
MPSFFRGRLRHIFFILFFLFFTVGCDQVTKVIAREALSTRSTSYWGDLIRLQHTENTGAFLGFGAELPPMARFWLFTVAIAVFLTGTFWFLLKSRQPHFWKTIALTLVLAGGVGNLIDRAWRGSVTDFLNLGIGWLRTGVFNVADMSIVAGIVILVILQARKNPTSSGPTTAEKL